MSVVVRKEDSEDLKCFCKGADEMVQGRLTKIGSNSTD